MQTEKQTKHVAGRFTMSLTALCCGLVLAGCNSSGYAVRNAPQAVSPTYGGNVTASGAVDAPVSSVPVEQACPAGATLVRAPSGGYSCAHSGGFPVSVGATSVFDPALAQGLSDQARGSGQSVAYTDGEYTIIVSPARP